MLGHANYKYHRGILYDFDTEVPYKAAEIILEEKKNNEVYSKEGQMIGFGIFFN